MPKIVGIDLGTTNSLIAYMDGDKPTLISNVENKFLTPSVVGIVKDQDMVVVGSSAKELSIINPELCAKNFKRLMGIDQKINLGGVEYLPQELSSFVLRSLKKDAESFFGSEVRDVVITVPAYFNDNQRRSTKLAGELAGLNVKRIINEPTAAALCYGLKNIEATSNVMVFDLGGGTFDITIMEISDGVMEVLSTAGVHDLGGEDFTDAIVGWVLKQKNMFLEHAEHQKPKFVSKLKSICDLSKIQLSDHAKVTIRVPEDDGSVLDSSEEIELDQNTFEEICYNLIRRIDEPFNRAIRDSRLTIKDINEIILVGGATRMKLIDRYLLKNCDVKPRLHGNPDYVVALGAAIQGAMLDEDDCVDDIVMTDICPHSLGVNISKSKGGQFVNGYFLPVIHRGTTIPVSREESVATIYSNQSDLHIEVYQGESRRVSENYKLGELVIQGIPKSPAGQEVILRFTYDPSNILEVEVIFPLNNTRKKLIINNQPGNIDSAEMSRAMERMKEVKFYPREDLSNFNLLMFAEKSLKETAPYQRQELEMLIDRYEYHLHKNEKEEFINSRNELLAALEILGFNYEP